MDIVALKKIYSGDFCRFLCEFSMILSDFLLPGSGSTSLFLTLFQVTVKDIEEFEKKYKGSPEEEEDIKKAYIGEERCTG